MIDTTSTLPAVLSLSLACGSIACGASTPQHVSGQRPDDGATTELSATPAPSDGLAARSSVADGPLVVIAELPERMRLHPIDDVLLAVATTRNDTGGLGSDDIGYRSGIVDALGRYTDKPELLLQAGSSRFFVVDAKGTFPQGVDLIATDDSGRTGIARHLTLGADGRWSDKTYQQGFEYVGLAVLEGATITMRIGLSLNRDAPTLVTLRGAKTTRTLQKSGEQCFSELLAKDPSSPREFMPRVMVTPHALGATRKGTLISVGSPCSGADNVEIWAPRSTTSTLASMPRGGGWEGVSQVIQGVGEDEAWLSSGGAVARFVDGRVEPLPSLPVDPGAASPGGRPDPTAESIVDIALSKAGDLHALTYEETKYDFTAKVHRVVKPSKLFRWTGAAWEVVSTPDSPTSIATASDGTLWVTANRLLLRERLTPDEQSKAVQTQREENAIRPGPGRMARTPGPLCPQNVVVMYGFTKVTPDDYDFPLTRKALKGQKGLDGVKFVVAKDGGQKFFSALVPDFATGNKLRALIEKKVVGSKPQLLCAQPEILRELRIDLVTGEVVKP